MKNTEDIFEVSLEELGQEVLDRAKEFSKIVVDQTFNRFSYSRDRRMEVLRIGKLAEEAFSEFIKKELGLKMKVNYDVYLGIENTDDSDFNIFGLSIDIKSSKDTKNEGFESCYSRFNFPVPVGQEVKDITVSIIYDYSVTKFYLASWIEKKIYLKCAEIRELPVGGGKKKKFYLYPLRDGKNIKTLKAYLIENGEKEKL
jgi:hypothetical protein